MLTYKALSQPIAKMLLIEQKKEGIRGCDLELGVFNYIKRAMIHLLRWNEWVKNIFI